MIFDSYLLPVLLLLALYLLWALVFKLIYFYYRVGSVLGFSNVHLHFAPLRGLSQLWNKKGIESHDDGFFCYKDFVISHPYTKAIVYSNLGNIVLIVLDLDMIQDFSLNLQNKFSKLEIVGAKNIMSRGLLFSQGAQWSEQKKTLAKVFHYENLINSIDFFISCSKKVLNQFKDKYRGTPMPALQLGKQLAGQIVMQLFFGPQFSKITVDGEPALKFATKVLQGGTQRNWSALLVRISNLIGLRSKVADMVGTQIQVRMARFRQICKDYIQNFIKEGRKALFLSVFLERFGCSTEKMPSEQQYDIIISQVLTFLTAGMDTTGHLIGISLSLLGQNKQLYNNLKKQAEENFEQIFDSSKQLSERIEGLKNCRQLQFFIIQTLRMYSPVKQIIFRRPNQLVNLSGIQLSKNQCYVNFAIGMNMFNPRFFSQPLSFKPDRWKKTQQPKDFRAFAPFFSGPRNCIGQHMSKLQTKLILLRILKQSSLQGTVDKLRMKMGAFYAPIDQYTVKID